ncbi:Serpentine Receptor, class Z [Caenorhabditis elegans]|uniref:Serpentine Receptor, class Z n=1 Tax=Caenorhabditis elegans TaxID=6239 RepID=Q7YWQ3_CAEEL|nr:Serpentine Receptor, class Z [Caenorhabditis elegans]CAE18004.2 Serpentine Receptor, class Z [Caenorhabditis elegans]|eukprot:NP_001024283.1 Serpentine Receptor, class Z [Caenorhabditis elegans]
MNNSFSNFDYLPDLFASASLHWILLMMLLSYISLPFYIYVHKINKQREESFPLIMKQFYKMVKIAYFCFFMVIVIGSVILLTFFSNILSNPSFEKFHIVLIIFLLFGGAVVTIQFLAFIVTLQVFHVLIFLIAIQNLLRFFFPLRFSLLKNSTDRYVKQFYIFFVSKEIACFLLFAACDNDFLPRNIWETGHVVYLITFLIMNVLISQLSPLIYIPIIWRTRKNKTLMYSQQHAYLYRYVFWQNVLVFSFKTIALPYLMENPEIDRILVGILYNDFSTLPLTIQLSYLWCNRHCLFINFNIKTFLKVLCGKDDVSVHPVAAPIVYSIT